MNKIKAFFPKIATLFSILKIEQGMPRLLFPASYRPDNLYEQSLIWPLFILGTAARSCYQIW